MRGLLLLCAALAAVSSVRADVGYKVTSVTSWNQIATSGSSVLYQAQLADNSAYDWPVYLVNLKGDSFTMGKDYGILLGQQMSALYTAFLQSLLGDSFLDEGLIWLVEQACDWQWDSYLSIELPTEYLEEIDGIAIGGRQIGVNDLDRKVTRVVTLANIPGDPQDFIYILIREWQENTAFNIPSALYNKLHQLLKRSKLQGLRQCSMFGVWGSRTVDGSLISARNLDWNKDTGMQQFKLITVYHPTGSYAHATLGYAGLIGALTGMSSQGLTVHEANLEEDDITFGGFPWVLRLRYIMANAKNLAEAKALWEKTNNTVGFNHMIGSAADAKSLIEETMYEYTAYFEDDDPRELNATYTDPKTGQQIQIGYPLHNAVWRTNHGYDPTIRKHFTWSQSPNSWSMQRYMFLHNSFVYYEQAGIKIDELAAINITAIAGDKGRHAYSCEDNTDGSNVLSATYHPSAQKLYVAWENGHDDTWRPACCNSYVEVDMSQWWN